MEDEPRRQPFPDRDTTEPTKLVKPTGVEPRAEPSPTRDEGTSSAGLWERMWKRQNLYTAMKRVESNGGAPGTDGMTVKELRPYLREHWLEIRAALESGDYRPSPVRRVEIAKPDGGTRQLGIPNVVDRLLQQAIAQVLVPIYEPLFSEHSYGFRPGHSAHGAVRQAQTYVQEGYTWCVDIDLEKYFDRVNHDLLMGRVMRVVKEKRVLKLIRAYLEAGVMINGVAMGSEDGVHKEG
jgi:RNA-directed DNA polymerase